MYGHNQGQFTGSHSARGVTEARKRSKTNFKNMMKDPNPEAEAKAAAKRERRRKRNVRQLRDEVWGRFYAKPQNGVIWLVGMKGVR